jgi:hypothetical protein
MVELVKLVELVENIKTTKLTKPTNSTNVTNFTNEEVLVVQKRHVEEAWRVLKKCTRSATEIINYVDMGKDLARVMEIIKRRYPEKIGHSDALRLSNLKAKDFCIAVGTLIQREEVAVTEIEVKSGIGRCVVTKKDAYVWLGKTC